MMISWTILTYLHFCTFARLCSFVFL